MAQSAPTKGNLIAARHSRELALTGFDLMDKKRNILIRELMAMTSRAKEIRGQIDSIFAAAYDSLTTAEISLTASTEAIVSVQIDDSLSMRYRSVMGVELSSVVSTPKEKEQMPFGLFDSNTSLDGAYLRFSDAKALILELADTENAIFRLAYAIRKTQKRANALKNIIIPSLDADIARISDVLDESQREEFTRLKVVKRKKQ